MKIIWKPIPEYEQYYRISNTGIIKRTPLQYSGVVANKILKPEITKLGYLRITLSKNGKTKRFLLHRLIALTFIENPNNLKQINHKDGNKSNNNVSNLEWCTAKYNLQHALDIGLRNISGENNGLSKLTTKDVLTIRQLYQRGGKWNTITLGNRFGVSCVLISMVVLKKIWKHV